METSLDGDRLTPSAPHSSSARRPSNLRNTEAPNDEVDERDDHDVDDLTERREAQVVQQVPVDRDEPDHRVEGVDEPSGDVDAEISVVTERA